MTPAVPPRVMAELVPAELVPGINAASRPGARAVGARHQPKINRRAMFVVR
jgi:hypothetical protein